MDVCVLVYEGTGIWKMKQNILLFINDKPGVASILADRMLVRNCSVILEACGSLACFWAPQLWKKSINVRFRRVFGDGN